MQPYYQDKYVTIYHGNCRDILPSLEPVDLVLTSPPYDDLREYKTYEWDFEDIATKLCSALAKGGVIVWIVGDATIDGSESGTSFKQALYFKGIGLNLHDTMIYCKENYMPLNHNRYEQQFEYMFVLSKGRPKVFNPFKMDTVSAGTIKSYTYNSGTVGEKKSAVRHHPTMMRRTEVKDDKIIPNIWGYQVGAGKTTKDQCAYQHPAVFPDKLASDHILSWTNPGDLVLDPMLGSGTTCRNAKILNRRSIGIEISEEYCEIAARRCQQEVMELNIEPDNQTKQVQLL